MVHYLNKCRPLGLLVSIACVLFICAVGFAETEKPKSISIAVPAETVSRFVEDLLPYEIPMGDIFNGALWVQTIDKIELGENSVAFFVKLLGKDIEFTTRIGDQQISLNFGEANVFSDCVAFFRYDRESRRLFVRPEIREFVDREKAGQAGEVLVPLLQGLSGIEYAVDLKKLKPVEAMLSKSETLEIKFDVSDVYSKNNTFFIDVIPSARKVTKKPK